MCNDSSIILTQMFTSVQLLKCLISLFFPFVLVPINTSSPLGKHSLTATNWLHHPKYHVWPAAGALIWVWDVYGMTAIEKVAWSTI